MKHYFGLLIIICQFVLCNKTIFAATDFSNRLIEDNTYRIENETLTMSTKLFKKNKNNLDRKKLKKDIWMKWLPLGLGVLGVGLVFIPYLSLIGLVFGFFALVSGVLLRKKYPKTARWGIWLGGFCVVAFLSILGLVLFF